MSRFDDLGVLEEIFGRRGTGPLAGVVVADLSRVLAGPYATMLLADMGATVIKVESTTGDDARAWVPPHRDGESTFFLSVNRNKQSISLDFSDPAQLKVVERIIARADVLVENFKPGGLRRYGLDYESVSAWRPDLVYASITGFGTAGGADLPGYDLLAQALSGMMSLTGSESGEPYRAGVALFDVITGLHAVSGILGAFHERQGSGTGQHVELNLLTSALSGLVNQSAAYVAGGSVPTRMGNEHPSLYPYEPFPTQDKNMVIAVGNNGQFTRLCQCLGAPELAVDERFATVGARNANRVELRQLLIDGLSTRNAADWFERLKAAQVPCAPILGVDEGVHFAEGLGLEPVVMAGSGERKIPTVRHPVDFSRTPVDYTHAPPRLDGDRDRVMAWLERVEPEVRKAS
ncbi:carnitine dehydratase [Nesterenkonia sp. AN1]|uniref:Crotonobetainyl-CoA:carnitine CoA-transferase CaiB-like acyl-CoA transferase n=1 Tax=Nesterenkonia aurantiaca TaxID=1436010 RepID=A0A4R7G7I8_9MICC|nr:MULTISPECIES: CoA transferase [Nesterenkonia]EXF25699.1 carnitine dehydratase [Nesterenkonia sp. AN1]TDS87385.1 crotonobetainyl-CoA:carnitine CoA-transferase CaiB-like acyl-CoA transferase [Nesterenkonia aurantiaca]